MQKNKQLILFTYDYPFGKSEKTFLEYELNQLSNDFDKIEIINQKNFKEKISFNFPNFKNIKFNDNFAKKITLNSLALTFFSKVIFEKIFWKQIFLIVFKKNFLRKLKMCINEMTLSFILENFICREKSANDKIIFYSFWSNFTLITFSRIRKIFKNSKFISRTLGSDLNGYIKDDNFVPYKNTKFLSLDKIFLLGEYQKKNLQNLDLNNKIEICPLGVYEQKINYKDQLIINEPITFISCGNLIEIKNNLLMIDFISEFNKITERKIKFILIGDGNLKKKNYL